MRKMKNSDIKWVGEIPANWATHPMYYYFNQRRHKNYLGTETNLLSLSYGRIVRKDINSLDGLVPESYNTYNIIEENDIVFRLTDLQNDKNSLRTGIAKNRGIITSAYVTIQPIKLINASYFHYLLHSYDINKVFYNMGNGVRQGLNFDELSKLMLVEPPIEEQNAIVDYLNKRCSEIDGIIADIHKQIAALEEYKRSVITEAVTKGLDSDVEMKDSGIEWIESIPQGWKINRIKYLFSNGKGLPITKENLITEGLSVINYGQIHAKFNTGVDVSSDLTRFVSDNYKNLFPQCEVFQYDFVFADTSEDYDGCGNCVYKRDDSLLYAGYHTIILHSLKRNDNRYFAYLFQTDLWRKQIRRNVSGVKVFSITQKVIMNAQVIIPSSKEQQQIANYLDRKCFEINSIIKEKQQQIETIARYKQSLLYEYVTGKKEIIAATTISVAIPYNILLAIVLDKIKNHEGKTQVLKLMYLVNQLFYPEYIIQYYRYEHGPYDIEIDSNLRFIKEQEWFNIDIHKSPMLWNHGKNYQAFKKACEPFSKHIKVINNLIKSVEKCTTKQLERFATLFAVWNDFIIDGIYNPSDEEIITEVLNNWTPNKKNVKKSTWQQSLNKMRVLNMIPNGKGLHTKKKGEK